MDKGRPISAGLTADEALQHPGNLGIICGEPSERLFIVDIVGDLLRLGLNYRRT
jgi:hypothetical protein